MYGRLILTSGVRRRGAGLDSWTEVDALPWRCSHGERGPSPHVFVDGNCYVEFAARVPNRVLVQIREQGGIHSFDEAWAYADSLDEHVGSDGEVEHAWRVLAHWAGVYGERG